jgi:hypothetical protein
LEFDLSKGNRRPGLDPGSTFFPRRIEEEGGRRIKSGMTKHASLESSPRTRSGVHLFPWRIEGEGGYRIKSGMTKHATSKG